LISLALWENNTLSQSLEIFATCLAGLEPLLAQELRDLGFSNPIEQFRGVSLLTDMTGVYRINYLSHLAGRVLIPIAHFRCDDKRDLYHEASKIDWIRYIPPKKTFAIDCNGKHPDLRNTLFASQVLKDAICDTFNKRTGSRPSIDTAFPDVQLNLFLTNRGATIGFDSSCVPLFKRGYRRETVEAPIQESLAAAILKIAGYTGEEILLDPCCGSGTFLIEAAYLATKTPPGLLRDVWGFVHYPDYKEGEWQKVKNDANLARIPLAAGKITGVEANKEAARICRANLRASGFHQQIQVFHEDFISYEPKRQPNLVICNPPHGRRLGDTEGLISLYRSLGDFFKQQCTKPAKAFIFTGNLDLSKEVGLKPKKRHEMFVGGVDCRLLEYDIY